MESSSFKTGRPLEAASLLDMIFKGRWVSVSIAEGDMIAIEMEYRGSIVKIVQNHGVIYISKCYRLSYLEYGKHVNIRLV